MAKITKIDVKTSTHQGKEKKSILITLDDGTSGYPTNKDADKSFREGDNVTYTKESKMSSQGKIYNTLTLTLVGGTNQTAPQTTQQPVSPPPRQPQTTAPSTSGAALKAQAATKALEFVIDCFIADKIQWDQIQPKHKELVGYLNDAIDDCLQG